MQALCLYDTWQVTQMKKIIILLVMAVMLVIISGCASSQTVGEFKDDVSVSETAASNSGKVRELSTLDAQKQSRTDTTQDKGNAELASVQIDFDYFRMSGKASNQIAIWIENEKGNVVKTIYVSDFTAARRGYENREDALTHWVASAKPVEMDARAIDAISGATLQTGSQQMNWDLTDLVGNRVSEGVYTIYLEGTLYWGSNVLYSAEVDLSSNLATELPVKMARSEPNNDTNETMIQNVRMYAITEGEATLEDNRSNWLGGLEPEEAFQYMKDHYDEGLVIIEVNTDYWKLQNGFIGAMHIPHDEMGKRYHEVPSDVPVILHCRAGVVSVPAYETLWEKRPDIKQLSYIAGRPPVDEFNEWVEAHK